MRFNNGIDQDEIYDLIVNLFDGNCGEAISRMSELEAFFGGELTEASEGAKLAMERGLLPVAEIALDGEEYHHMYFDGEGVKSVCFK